MLTPAFRSLVFKARVTVSLPVPVMTVRLRVTVNGEPANGVPPSVTATWLPPMPAFTTAT